MKKYFILASLLSLSSLALATPNLVHEAEDTGDITLKVIRPVKLEVGDVDLGHVLAGKKLKGGKKADWHIEVPEQDGNLHELALIQYNLLFRDKDNGFGSQDSHKVGFKVNHAANGTIIGGDFQQTVGDDQQIYVKLVGGHSGHELKALVEIVPEGGQHINNNLDQRLTGRIGVLKVDGLHDNNGIVPTDAKADTYKGTVVATLKPAFPVNPNWE